MTRNNQLLYYKGFFSYQVVNNLVNELFLLEQSGVLNTIAFKKIQIVMVEMLENSYKYTSGEIRSFNHPDFFPEFRIFKENKSYRLIASNPIHHEDLPELKQRLDKINHVDLSGLRKWYKEVLKNELYSKKQSPGIGLMRMAKVVRNKFNYTFQKIDNNFLYYTLEILINTK